MTAEERKLYSALLKFFKQLAINPATKNYFKKPALNKDGELGDFDGDTFKIEFFALKSAITTVVASGLALENPTDKDLEILTNFFTEMTKCHVSLEPMVAPMYLNSQDVNFHVSLYDAKQIYIFKKQLPDSQLGKEIKAHNVIAVNALFKAMQNFSKEIAHLDANLLHEKFDTDINRIKQWQFLPPMSDQIKIWDEFDDTFEKKANKFIDEMPSYAAGLGVAFLHKLYIYCRYDEAERQEINHGIYFPIILISTYAFAAYKQYLHNYYFNQVINSDDVVKGIEDKILAKGLAAVKQNPENLADNKLKRS